MSIFKKSDSPPPRPRERSPHIGKAGLADGAISIIGPGMIIEGDIVTDGTVRVEGELRGTVRAGKTVIIGPAGRVDGSIITEDAVIGGTVHGSIVAKNRLELQATSSVIGEIHTRAEKLKLEEGARFAGHVQMNELESSAAPAAPLPGPAAVAFPFGTVIQEDELESEGSYEGHLQGVGTR